MTPKQLQVINGLLNFFQIEGRPADEVATPGQKEIFAAIVFRTDKRLHIETSTQYGKSLFVALASIIVSCIQKELVAIVAPTNEKAKIIMRYYIGHLADSPIFHSQLEKDTKLERLIMEESKERIVLRNGGGIFVVSVQAGNTKKTVEAAMGLGAKIVIEDESCLIPNETEATIFRMIAGKGPDAFYCKIGNPFYRNHFLSSFNDPNYRKIVIDYKQAVLEGRYSAEYIEEARHKPKFDVLFECKFPPPEALDSEGYSILLSEDFLKTRLRPTVPLFGVERLGCDVAGEGSNYSVIVKRGHNGAKILYKERNPDIMNFTGIVLLTAKTHKISGRSIYVDKVGIGKGVYDRLREFPETKDVVGVSAGSPATDDKNFLNKRAEMFWRVKNWLSFGELEGEGWLDLIDIRYKVQSDRKVKIKSKDEMIKEGVASPDVADALSLTFYDLELPQTTTYTEPAYQGQSQYEGSEYPHKTSLIKDMLNSRVV